MPELVALSGIADLIGAEKGATGVIIGTGLSLEGYDFSEIDHLPTIAMNEATKLVIPDYLVIADAQAVSKALPFLEKNQTTLVMAQRCYEFISARGNLMANLEMAKEVRVAKFTHLAGDPTETVFYSCGILTGALSLACALGWKKVYLFGCDFYRKLEQLYCHDLSPARPENMSPHPDDGILSLFMTPAFKSMRKAIEENLQAWEGLEVVNMSRYSTLGCFPIGDEALPREG